MPEIKSGQRYISNKDRDDRPHTILVVLGKSFDGWHLSAEVAGKPPQTFFIITKDLIEHLEEHWRLIFDPTENVGYQGTRNRLEEVE